MKPDNLLKEYISALASGGRFILLLIISSVITGRLEKLFGFKNFIIYFFVLAAVYILIELLLGLLGTLGKKKKTKELRRGGYD